MDQLKEYVFIAEIRFNSKRRIGDLYKSSVSIYNGLKLNFLSNNDVCGKILFKNVVNGVYHLNFEVLIETDLKTMFEFEKYYTNAIKNCLQSILVLDGNYDVNVIKLRIPSLLIQGKLNPKIYRDLDGHYYKINEINNYIRIDSPTDSI